MNLYRFFIVSLSLLVAGNSFASEAVLDKLKQKLAGMFPGETGYSVSKTPIEGLFEIDFGDSFMYLSSDGQYAFKGDIINVSNGFNLTDKKRADARLEALSALSEKDMIVYPATTKQKLDSLTVFTDIDCSYCRKLHSSMADYNRRGIEIRYVFYPRAGIGSSSYDKAVSVWCAKDRRKALDSAKALQGIKPASCDNPVLKHIDVAGELGVNSTPVMFTSSGEVIPGYLPPARLALTLQQLKPLASR